MEMKNEGSNHVVQAIVYVLIFLFILLMIRLIPVLNLVLMLLLPLPIIAYMLRRGVKAGAILGLVTFIISTLLWPGLFILSLIGVTVGLVMGYFYLKQKGPFIPVLAGMLTYLMNYLFIFILSVYLFDFNFMEIIESSQDEMLRMNPELNNFLQVPLDENQLSLYKEYINIIASLLPYFMILSSIVMAGLHQFVNRLVLNRLGYDIHRLPKFRTWTFPKAVLFYYLISLFISLLGIVTKESTFYASYLNLHMILATMMFIQGLAVIAYFSYAKRMGPALPVLAVILSLFIPPVGTFVVRLLGILELGFQLRQRMNK